MLPNLGIFSKSNFDYFSLLFMWNWLGEVIIVFRFRQYLDFCIFLNISFRFKSGSIFVNFGKYIFAIEIINVLWLIIIILKIQSLKRIFFEFSKSVFRFVVSTFNWTWQWKYDEFYWDAAASIGKHSTIKWVCPPWCLPLRRTEWQAWLREQPHLPRRIGR